MRHERPAPRQDVDVDVVPYDVAQQLRALWHMDYGDGTGDYPRQAREVAMRRGAETLVIHEDGCPIAFAQLERDGAAAEVTEVYAHPDHRGRRLGTALVLSAIERAGDVRDLWITADDEERAKELYARLGFAPIWTSMNFLRVLDDRSGAG